MPWLAIAKQYNSKVGRVQPADSFGLVFRIYRCLTTSSYFNLKKSEG